MQEQSEVPENAELVDSKLFESWTCLVGKRKSKFYVPLPPEIVNFLHIIPGARLQIAARIVPDNQKQAYARVWYKRHRLS